MPAPAALSAPVTSAPTVNAGVVLPVFAPSVVPAAAAPAPMPLTQPGWVSVGTINDADTSWMMTSTALVLLMTLPGIALFYGGNERLWFSGLDYAKEAQKVAVSYIAPNIPESVYAMFQLTFAIITAALVVGSFVERMRFSATLIFTALRTVVVYAPIAHWVLEPNGWLARLGALDFTGGSVVHINAGAAGLVCAYVLGPRRGYGREPFLPFNLGLAMAGRPTCGLCRSPVLDGG